MHGILIVFLAGLIAGAMNAAAGGGSFVSVPALIYVGIPSVSANMSSTIALYPGSLTSGWAYRRNFQPILNVSFKVMFLATLAGGFGGAILLLLTPSSAFDKIIPWLLLLGSLAFAFGPWLGDGCADTTAKYHFSDGSAISSGRLWRLLWRRSGDHDDGGLEFAWPHRYQGDECR